METFRKAMRAKDRSNDAEVVVCDKCANENQEKYEVIRSVTLMTGDPELVLTCAHCGKEAHKVNYEPPPDKDN